MRLFTIVVTFNGEKWIEKCIESIENSVFTNTYIENHIIILDNASNDKTIQILNEYSYVQLIETGANLGFGKSNNIGIEYALKHNADYILLLNQDAYLFPDTLEKLIMAHQKEPHYDLICPVQLHNSEEKLDLIFSVDIFPGICPDIISDGFMQNLRTTLYPAKFVNAACWLMTKNCVNIIGGFSPIFKHYGEDNNYCLRLEYHGLKIGICAQAFVIHDKDYPERDYFKSYPEIQERQQLVKFSDPNNPSMISEERKNYLRYSIGALIKLNFKKFKKLFKEYKRLKNLEKNIVPLVLKSQQKGKNFLNVK